jgi:hypothetical protein
VKRVYSLTKHEPLVHGLVNKVKVYSNICNEKFALKGDLSRNFKKVLLTLSYLRSTLSMKPMLDVPRIKMWT